MSQNQFTFQHHRNSEFVEGTDWINFSMVTKELVYVSKLWTGHFAQSSSGPVLLGLGGLSETSYLCLFLSLLMFKTDSNLKPASWFVKWSIKLPAHSLSSVTLLWPVSGDMRFRADGSVLAVHTDLLHAGLDFVFCILPFSCLRRQASLRSLLTC